MTAARDRHLSSLHRLLPRPPSVAAQHGKRLIEADPKWRSADWPADISYLLSVSKERLLFNTTAFLLCTRLLILRTPFRILYACSSNCRTIWHEVDEVGCGLGKPCLHTAPPQTAGRAVAGLTPSLICLLNASSLAFPVFACSPSYSPSAAASLTTGPFLPCQ